MLEVKNITKTYYSNPTHFKTAVKDVSFSIGQGELVGIFGENGAGKSTLMKCMLGLISHKGEVLLDGEPLSCKNITRLSFATCEHSFFPALNAEEHASFYRDHFPGFDRKRFDVLMKFFGLPYNQKAAKLSVGQQNQLEVVLALCQGADYILMDEPFAGNDVFNREDFYKVLIGILREDETIILSTHLIEEVSGFIGRALFLHQGQLIGDYDVLDLNDQGISLMDKIREAYSYEGDRIRAALDELGAAE